MYHRAGADLREECPVKDAVLDKTAGMWTVTLEDDTTFRARVRSRLALWFACRQIAVDFFCETKKSMLQ